MLSEKVAGFPNDVTVVVVAHNAWHILPIMLDSLFHAGCREAQITVADVASTDGTVEKIRSTYPKMTVRSLKNNDGPNPARNIGILEAPTPFVLLMDSDVTVEPQTVQRLRAKMNGDSSIAIGSPIVVYGDQPEIIQYAGTSFHFIGEAINNYQGKARQERGSECQMIGCASGNALLIAKEAAIRVGLFDPEYFMGKEDGDFTHRIVLAGYKILEDPTAIVHHHGKTREQGLFYYQIRNRWHFMLKNYQWKTLVFLAPVLLIHEGMQFAMLAMKGCGKFYVQAILGLLKMIPQLPAHRRRVRQFRVRKDADVLQSAPIVVRKDFLNKSYLRVGKKMYEEFLNCYWRSLIRLKLIS